jgi:hypothetical protein
MWGVVEAEESGIETIRVNPDVRLLFVGETAFEEVGVAAEGCGVRN